MATKKQILDAIHRLNETKVAIDRGIPVYYQEKKTTVHIYSIGAPLRTDDDSKFTQRELQEALFHQLGEQLPEEKRTYHFTDIEKERARLKRQEEKLHPYKNPLTGTHTEYVTRISKSGKTYRAKVEVQDVALEKAFRSAQREYNKAAREWEQSAQYMSEQSRKNTYEVNGRVSAKKFARLYAEQGPERAREYVAHIRARTHGAYSADNLNHLRASLNTLVRAYQSNNWDIPGEMLDAEESFWVKNIGEVDAQSIDNIIDAIYGAIEACRNELQEQADSLTITAAQMMNNLTEFMSVFSEPTKKKSKKKK